VSSDYFASLCDETDTLSFVVSHIASKTRRLHLLFGYLIMIVLSVRIEKRPLQFTRIFPLNFLGLL